MLSILIPTYNRPEMLSDLLRSIVAGFAPTPQVIIGDNGNAAVTAELISRPEFASLQVKHLCNPPKSTYVQNLQWLIDACETEWMCILHDDDFFVGDVSSQVTPILADPYADFLFTDHWVAEHSGEINEQETTENSQRYLRASLDSGPINNLPLMVLEQRVCLDGFYVRTQIAKSNPLPLGYKVFADNIWLVQIATKCQSPRFSKAKTFAYRLNQRSLTATQFDHEELLRSLLASRSIVQSNPTAAKQLKARVRSLARLAVKSNLKKKSILGAIRVCRHCL